MCKLEKCQHKYSGETERQTSHICKLIQNKNTYNNRSAAVTFSAKKALNTLQTNLFYFITKNVVYVVGKERNSLINISSKQQRKKVKDAFRKFGKNRKRKGWNLKNETLRINKNVIVKRCVEDLLFSEKNSSFSK